MKNNYCKFYDKIYLSEDKKEEIYCLLKERTQAKTASANGKITVYKPEATRGKFKVIAIPAAAAAVAAVCIASILIVYFAKNSPSLPIDTSPAEGIIYNSGITVTDAIYGSTICLESARLTDNVTVGGEVYYSESGKFIVISGTADVNFSDIAFNKETVELICYLSDATQTALFDFRVDLFELSYESGVHGEIVLIFETDADGAEKVTNEINDENTLLYPEYAENAGFLVMLDFRVYGKTTAYAAVNYKFTFDEIVIE